MRLLYPLRLSLVSDISSLVQRPGAPAHLTPASGGKVPPVVGGLHVLRIADVTRNTTANTKET